MSAPAPSRSAVALRASWPRAFLLSIPIALWLFALAVVSVAGAVNWDNWRRSVAESKADLDPRPREDHEMFPGYHEDVRERVSRAETWRKWANRKYGGDLGICVGIGAALIAVAVLYRRRVPRERRPTWRTWVLVVPIVAGFVALGLMGLGYAMRGAITG